MAEQPEDFFRRAADPAISQQELFELAGSHPETYPVVASNPQAYPQLLDWLGKVGDPFTVAVVEQRARGLVGNEAYDAARAQFMGTQPDARPASDSGQGEDEQQTHLLQSQGTPAPAAEAQTPADAQETRVIPTQPATAEATPTKAEPARTSILGAQQTSARTPQVGVPEQPAQYQPQPQSQLNYQPASAPTTPADYRQDPHSAPAAPARAGRMSPALLVLLILGIVAIIAASATAFFLLKGANPKVASTIESTQRAKPSSAPQQSLPSTADSAQPSSPATSAAVVLPPPPGALPLKGFISPSKNIACSLGQDSARCTILEHKDPRCDGGPMTLVISKSGTVISCKEDDVVGEGGDTLHYGQAAAFGDFACTSASDGIRCWDTKTRHALLLSRSAWSNADQ